jgi:hypothetical protein
MNIQALLLAGKNQGSSSIVFNSQILNLEENYLIIDQDFSSGSE